MTDVLLFQTPDGGEVTFENGQPLMDDGLETAAYLSLFGGNEEDSGGDEGKPVEWWGNKIESDASKKLRSHTQFLLRSIPITSGNIVLIEDAVAQDLAWMVETKLASFVGGTVSIPALNTIRIDVKIVVQDKTYAPVFLYKRSAAS
jgi:phage gp46-like protein